MSSSSFQNKLADCAPINRNVSGRENAAWNQIRIVMLSAKGRDVEVTKGMAVGADAYVTKPFSTRDLIAKVQELLGE